MSPETKYRAALLAISSVVVAGMIAGCGSGEDEGQDSAGRASESSAVPSRLDRGQRAAVDAYRDFVERNADELVRETDRFLDAVAAGNIERAKDLYTAAHVPFERIEPVAGALGDLDPALDAREGDVPDRTFGGFHFFEQALWIEEDTSGLEPYIEETTADVERLREVAATIELTPTEIATGSVDLLGEVSASKITGEEERYSHTDLWDFEANVDGAQAAFEAVKPLIQDAALVAGVEARFDDVLAALDEYRRGEGFVFYTDLGEADTRELSRVIDALAEPLSTVASQLG